MVDSKKTGKDGTTSGDEPESAIPCSEIVLQSLGRQFYCFGGVVGIPTFDAMAKSLGPTTPRKMEVAYFVTHTIGALLGGCFVHFLGRKYAIVLSNGLFALLFLLVFAIVEYDQYVDFKVLLVFGIHSNFSYVSSILYLAEITNHAFLAFFVGLYHLSHSVGFEIMRLMTYRHSVALLAMCYSLVAGGLTLFSLFIPETPLCLALNDNREKATNVFTWIRAGNSDAKEFKLMIDRTDTIKQRGFKKSVLSLTFGMSVIFCVFVTFIYSDACHVQTAILNGFYFAKLPHRENKSEIVDAAYQYFYAIKDTRYQNQFPGILAFMGLNFVVPRKVILSMAFLLNKLLAVPVLLTPQLELFMKISFFCHTINGATFPGLLILYAELFPVTSRVYGVALASVIYSLDNFLYTSNFTSAKDGVALLSIGQYWTYFGAMISFIGLPFLLNFMPETKRMNMYEFEEFKFTNSAQNQENKN